MPRKHTQAELRAMYWGKPVPAHLVHGVQSNAKRFWGCDCRKCLPSGRRLREPRRDTPAATHAERQRKLRESKRGKPVPPTVKHGIYAYRIYGCQCEVCLGANRTQGRRGRKRGQFKLNPHGRWSTGTRHDRDHLYSVDIICWPPRDAEPDWTCPCESGEERRAA